MPSIFPLFRLSLIAALLAAVGNAEALGLGEIRTRSFLGEQFLAEVDVLAGGAEMVDAACFRLRPPTEKGELPWLQRASLRLRKGPPLVLELRSEQPTREPVLQVAIQLSCGHEIQRDYTIFLSPRGSADSVLRDTRSADTPSVSQERPLKAMAPLEPPLTAAKSSPPRQTVRQASRLAVPVLVAGSGGGGALSLRLSTELSPRHDDPARIPEQERDALRLEYRLLLALNEEAVSSLPIAERMRRVAASLGDLQSRISDSGKSADRTGGEAGGPGPERTSPLPVSTQMVRVPEKPAVQSEQPVAGKTAFLAGWGIYGGIMALGLLVAGTLGVIRYRARAVRADFSRLHIAPELLVDPIRDTEIDEIKAVAKRGLPPPGPAEVFQDKDGRKPAVAQAGLPEEAAPDLSVAKATVDELVQVTPVMELAEIMLSFGRVKGAAQALQEFIDSNPQEALQPWIRLLDVYRMAGMRDEFERLARNLNQNFNVEVQYWADGSITDGEGSRALTSGHDLAEHELSLVARPKAVSLEEIGHIRNKLVETWGTPACREYLHHLLRDNRGGQRSGFPLSVIEEILFLIELDEIRASMPRDKS